MQYLFPTQCFRARISVGRVAARRFISQSADRIYVAACSAEAQFIAHSLCDGPKPPPVSLITNKQRYDRAWRRKECITLWDARSGEYVRARPRLEFNRSPFRRHGRIIPKDEFEAEPMFKPHYDALGPGEHQADVPIPTFKRSDEPIMHLVIAEQPQYVVSQLFALKHRIRPESTILIVSTVLGVLDEVIEKVFPNVEHRPHFMLGESTHAIIRPRQSVEAGSETLFQIVHDRIGYLYISRDPLLDGRLLDPTATADEKKALPAGYLLETLKQSSKLSVLETSALELHMRQLDAVALRSVIRPLTALMDSQNGTLLHNFYLTRSMRLVIAETSLIIRSLPEIRGHPLADSRYGPERLERVIVGILKSQADALSTTLVDVRRGRRTDVDYVNGYLVKRAHELGLKAFMNFLMCDLVKGKSMLIGRERAKAVRDEFGENEMGIE